MLGQNQPSIGWAPRHASLRSNVATSARGSKPQTGSMLIQTHAGLPCVLGNENRGSNVLPVWFFLIAASDPHLHTATVGVPLLQVDPASAILRVSSIAPHPTPPTIQPVHALFQSTTQDRKNLHGRSMPLRNPREMTPNGLPARSHTHYTPIHPLTRGRTNDTCTLSFRDTPGCIL